MFQSISQNFWQMVSEVSLKFRKFAWQFHYVVVNQIVNLKIIWGSWFGNVYKSIKEKFSTKRGLLYMYVFF